MGLASTLVLVVFIPCVVSQEFTYITIPPTDGGPAYVFADNGTINVTIFCQLFQNGERFLVPWQIQRATDNMFVRLLFTGGVSTEPDGVAGDISVTGDPFPNITGLTYRSNLTIAVFSTAEYDGSSIRCGASTSPDQRTFNFGFPSKYWKWSSGMISYRIYWRQFLYK